MTDDDPNPDTDDEPERRQDTPTPDGDTDDGQADRAPMEELARRVEQRQEEAKDGADEERLEEAFEPVEQPNVDVDEVWADLNSGSEDEPITTGETVETAVDGDVRVIPKRTCHTCPYFGAPPDLHCTHDGTEIREVVSPDEFEVVDCPMVVDEEELGGGVTR
ncbi:MAG: hypothetical protein ABEJ35_06325 [Halobacteriaceae archaeon]